MTTSADDGLVLDKNAKAAGMWSSGGRAYDEVSAATGGLNRIRSINLMPMLLDLINRTEKFGA